MERSAGTTILGRLELIREETPSVGVQVFGPTWAVLDSESGELARACVLDAELLPNDERRAAFVAGLEALTNHRDPTLVPQLYAGADEHGGGVLYEPVPGGVAFDDLYDGTGSYDLSAEVGRLARQLARALASLHARGHVHGMLTSACVFVGPRGPAVYQYGLAPLCDRAVLLRRVRAFGLTNVAPEVMNGGEFTPVADNYAWAVTVAQFAASARGSAAIDAVRGGPELPGLSPALRAVVLSCLAEDPAARPHDGAELVRLIELTGLGENSGAARADESTSASPVPEDTSSSPVPEDSKPAESIDTAAASTSSAPAPVEEPRSPPVVEPAPAPAPVAAPPAPVVTPAPVTPTGPPSRPPTIPPPRPPAKDRPPTIPPAGMSLPVTSYEEMLMPGDRQRRPGTIPPGSLNAAPPAAAPPAPVAAPQAIPPSGSSTRGVIELSPEDLMNESGGWTRGGLPSGKSASNLRRVRVLTDPLKRGNTETSSLIALSRTPPPDEAGDVPPSGDLIIGGTREELEAASRATTLRLDPTSAAAAVQAATRAAAAAAIIDEPILEANDPPKPEPAAEPGPVFAPQSHAARSGAVIAAVEANEARRSAALATEVGGSRRSGAVETNAPRRSGAAGDSSSGRRSGATASAGESGVAQERVRRRSTAVPTGGSEPRDWGTIPPISEIVQPAPAVVQVATPRGAVSKLPPNLVPILVVVAVVIVLIVLAL